ncbi:MAG: hypothetical protein ACRCXG_16120 [Vibrio sp.]
MPVKGSETIEIVLTMMRQLGDCSANQLATNPACHVSQSAVKNILAQMTKHDIVTIVGKERNGHVYRLTGLTPYAQCDGCGCCIPRWNLRDDKCAYCQRGNKGTNQQLLSDFEFLKNPTFTLIKQVFHPLEEV